MNKKNGVDSKISAHPIPPFIPYQSFHPKTPPTPPEWSKEEIRCFTPAKRDHHVCLRKTPDLMIRPVARIVRELPPRPRSYRVRFPSAPPRLGCLLTCGVRLRCGGGTGTIHMKQCFLAFCPLLKESLTTALTRFSPQSRKRKSHLQLPRCGTPKRGEACVNGFKFAVRNDND